MKLTSTHRAGNALHHNIFTRYFAIAATLFSLTTATACGQAPAQNSAESTAEIAPKPIPEGAIRFDYKNHLYFDAVIRDTLPVRLVFDTGNTNLLLDSTFYAENFATQGTLRRAFIGGAGNSREIAWLDISKWTYKVGDHDFTGPQAVVVNLRKILGNNVDGLFGMEFMRGRKVEFNYADEYIRFLSSEEQPDNSYTCIDCKWLDDSKTRIILPATLQLDATTSREGLFLVDLGSSGTVTINSSSVAKMGLQGRSDVSKMTYAVGGIGGSRTDYMFKLADVELGGLSVKDIRGDYSGNAAGSLADKRYDGLIGNLLLERFDVVFDFAECKIWLRPNRNFDKADHPFFGVALTPQKDYWTVNGLLEGGNAEKAGMKRGDKIVKINGKSPCEMSKEEQLALINSPAPWRATIERNGSTIEVEITPED